MAERLVVADASPLIGLAAAGGFELLRRLLRADSPSRPTSAMRCWPVASCRGRRSWQAPFGTDGSRSTNTESADATAFLDLDAGEASTLTLAVAHAGPCLVLVDESLGRARARAHGLRCDRPCRRAARRQERASRACRSTVLRPLGDRRLQTVECRHPRRPRAGRGGGSAGLMVDSSPCHQILSRYHSVSGASTSYLLNRPQRPGRVRGTVHSSGRHWRGFQMPTISSSKEERILIPAVAPARWLAVLRCACFQRPSIIPEH